ncbi:methyltransferase-like protein 17, mitochondrial [Pogonomyrmex barbatus]|uniref:Methyltransferase-like protein 17, mitochondrial n=1 Tax=Pogonomyrmex barbatus TaxID=144034 RepID=A0A6I9WVZ6_9HYME|nr:methyltransferase-like protein 17, mitochondrial [Pogonomyrmex barbatus]XP_011636083.1 methyltransferase-like protein 17, mitochondrial [Pogonomyrmex barbatus]XP_011636085.1 methyltransferase-like protein 17, mitochondrial [Pogonomyrmex barbatus]
MVRLIVSRMHCTSFIPLRYFSAKPKVILDNAVSTLLSNNEMKHRFHPGIVNPRTPIFPQWSIKEIRNILKEKQIVLKEIKESAKKLTHHLNKRHPPLEQSELTSKLLKVEERLNINNHGEKILIEDINLKKNAKARLILKQNIYNWQPINYDKFTSLTYLVGRCVQNYTVSHKIFDEIKSRDKNFKPTTLFDFGSGIGTVMWTASEIWPNTLKEYFCVETSESMIELSERLAKVAKPKIKDAFYRQYFPLSTNRTYDIVVSAYSLFELPGMESRLDIILKLWANTENYLVIIEEGTNAGFKLVNEARDLVLKYANSKHRRGTQFAHVFAPCPHDFECPRRATDNTPCNFSVLYHPLQFLGGRQHIPELYSYVILKKTKRSEDDEQWPRIVRSVLKRSNHTICRMCTAKGELKEEIFTKCKHGRHMYRCARVSEWGDRLPLHYEQQQENQETDIVNEIILKNENT